MNDAYEFVESEAGSVSATALGRYSKDVYEKHEQSYGKSGADKTRNAAMNILEISLLQEENPEKSNNVLLVGKVQSGKTSNLEALVGLAFDNGFQLIVMYGGYDNDLLKQTVKRFRKTFNSPSDEDDLDNIYEDKQPIVFSTDDKDEININELDADVIRDYINAQVPVVIITIKGANRIKQISKTLDALSDMDLRTFIIDDEGDQASLNNAKDKANDASPTYNAICCMKETLGDPIYYSVTATPHPNVFLNEFSKLRPSSIYLLHPAKGYCGSEIYHCTDNNIIVCVADEMDDSLEENRSPDSLKDAVRHFVIASAILSRRRHVKRCNKTDMVIHSYRELQYHKIIYNWIDQYIKELKDSIGEALSGDSTVAKAHFKSVYDNYFDKETKFANPLDMDLIKDIDKVLNQCAVVMRNGRDHGTLEKGKHKRHVINIGAQLLERGITFDHLLSTYFTRWAKSGGNMDTNLQRARWFGYRREYLDLCKLFTTETIAEEFTYLADSENDLWMQFADVEAGDMSINEIVIKASENMKQKPTRRSVADYLVVSTNAWMKQQFGNFDQKSIRVENSRIENFLNTLNFVPKSYGRTDGKYSCREAIANTNEIESMFKGLDAIYDRSSFRLDEIMRVLKEYDKAAIICIPHEFNDPRERSFWEEGERSGKVKALQQGRDTRNPDEAAYLGDKHVIDNNYPLTVQVYHIRPKRKDANRLNHDQYMFAIYQRNELKKGYRAQ